MPNGSPLISECHSCPSRPSRLQYHTTPRPIAPTIRCNVYSNCRSQISSSPSGPSPIIVVGNAQSPLPFALRSTTEISCPSPRSTPRSNTRFHDECIHTLFWHNGRVSSANPVPHAPTPECLSSRQRSPYASVARRRPVPVHSNTFDKPFHFAVETPPGCLFFDSTILLPCEVSNRRDFKKSQTVLMGIRSTMPRWTISSASSRQDQWEIGLPES